MKHAEPDNPSSQVVSASNEAIRLVRELIEKLAARPLVGAFRRGKTDILKSVEKLSGEDGKFIADSLLTIEKYYSINKSSVFPDDIFSKSMISSVCRLSTGDAVFADELNHCLRVCGKDGKEMKIAGRKGTAPGEFNRPVFVVENGGEIFVADAWNHRIQVFDGEFKLKRTIGEIGTAPGQFIEPWSICSGPDDALFVADRENSRIQLIDRKGKFISSFGEYGIKQGLIAYPVAVAAGGNETLYVADSTGRVQRFSYDGEYIKTVFERSGVSAILSLPSGFVLVLSDGNRVFSCVTAEGAVVWNMPVCELAARESLRRGGLCACESGEVLCGENSIVLNDAFCKQESRLELLAFLESVFTSEDAAHAKLLAEVECGVVTVGDTALPSGCPGFTGQWYLRRMAEVAALQGRFGQSFEIADALVCFDAANVKSHELLESISSSGGVSEEIKAECSDGIKTKPVIRTELEELIGGKYLISSFRFADDVNIIAGTMTGEILHINTKENKLRVFSLPYRVITGIAPTSSGTMIVVSNAAAEIIEVSPDGEIIRALNNDKSGGKAIISPCTIVELKDGTFVLTDFEGCRIVRISGSGELLATHGKKGAEPGNFILPYAMAVLKDGNIAVMDFYRPAVQIFTPELDLVKVFEIQTIKHAALLPGVDELHIDHELYQRQYIRDSMFRRPAGIAISDDGSVFVPDDGFHKIHVLSGGFEYQYSFGSFGNGVGMFNRPIAASISPAGELWIIDMLNCRFCVCSL